jgi:organic hydroperoxide reductase OsmC/OhrA
MQIWAKVTNQLGEHRADVRTGTNEQALAIPGRPQAVGSGVNGGELLFLALATCYCNDLYREANERGIEVESVQVEVTGHFSTKGAPAEDIQYRASVRSKNKKEEVLELMLHTDSVAEIHNTLRRGTAVTLSECTFEDGHP